MVGIVTYHSAYNYGSVLQAYATQEVVNRLNTTSQIINYRMPEQRKFYQLYRIKYGYRSFLKDLMQLPVHVERKERIGKFEDFIARELDLSKECKNYQEVCCLWNKYSTIISGSDQIWNKHSQELEHNRWEYMRPYLLDGYKGRKISYASSVGNMNDLELERIKPSLLKFDAIAMREPSSAKRIGELIGKDVPWVVDPTFLLDRQEWISKFNLIKNCEKYILYYSLLGIHPLKEVASVLKIKAQKLNCKIKIITPFAYLHLDDDYIEIHPELGPIDFLQAIYNACMIVTSSYHGTIFSVNLHKDVYSLCDNNGSEFRKIEILKELGLDDRIIYKTERLLDEFQDIDYDKVENKLAKFRNNSLNYLKNSI